MFFAQPENSSHANQPFVPDCHGNFSSYTEPTPGNSPGADVEKNATQRAKHVAEQKLCFACLQSNHSFRNCSKARKCPKPDCESTHNVLLHGAEKIFPPKDTKSSPASGNANSKHVSTNAAVGDIHSQESTKGLLPVASLAVSSDATITNALALCDSASTHSWVSADLVKRLHFVGTPVNLTINGFNSTSLMKTHQVSFQVSAETNNSDFSFSFRAYVKDHIRIGSDSISIPELQEKYPQLAPIKPIHYKYEEVEIIIGQDFYHAIRPVVPSGGGLYFTVRRTPSNRLGFKWSVTAVL